LGIVCDGDKVPFHSYYFLKDFFGFALLTSVLCYLVFMEPNYFLESVNFSPANPIVTPPHIVPEWYFLFAYAILRVVPSKLGGVFALVSAVLSPLLLPLLPASKMKSLSFYGPVKLFFWLFVINFLLLTSAGTWPIVLPYSYLTSLFSVFYFLYFFFIPLLKCAWDLLIHG
jgi:ubiquinol-cytochrome c reductase cytochrome b subunit